jgi:hypothetical protein
LRPTTWRVNVAKKSFCVSATNAIRVRTTFSHFSG